MAVPGIRATPTRLKAEAAASGSSPPWIRWATAWVYMSDRPTPRAKWPMAMAQNGKEDSAAGSVHSRWGARRCGEAAAGAAAVIGSPSGSCPMSSGRRRCSTAFKGTSDTSTVAPSSTRAARQPYRVIRTCATGTIRMPKPSPMVAKPRAVPRRRRNQWDSSAVLLTNPMQPMPRPTSRP